MSGHTCPWHCQQVEDLFARPQMTRIMRALGLVGAHFAEIANQAIAAIERDEERQPLREQLAVALDRAAQAERRAAIAESKVIAGINERNRLWVEIARRDGVYDRTRNARGPG